MVFDLVRMDVKLHAVLDPSSAEEAHWSLRHRFQGQIEGSIKKLQAERKQAAEEDDEKLGVGNILARNLAEEFEAVAVESGLGESRGSPIWNDGSKGRRIAEKGSSSRTECSSFVVTPSPPHAPIITNRMRFMDGEDRYEDLGVGRRLSTMLDAEFKQVESSLGKNRGIPLMIKKLNVQSSRIGACGTPTWEKRGSIRAFR
ncbi:uncharacterized protein LOC132310270 [Cornus florida]|uniref:uncharacterized protein LOC132310270 n=1 Tax=Cornus florida TaxID=4283 RepID=UPI00289B0C56|nr:uncharacterized protein LOC132310270 [Cornus florida]